MNKKELSDLQTIIDLGNDQLRQTFSIMSEMHEKMVSLHVASMKEIIKAMEDENGSKGR